MSKRKQSASRVAKNQRAVGTAGAWIVSEAAAIVTMVPVFSLTLFMLAINEETGEQIPFSMDPSVQLMLPDGSVRLKVNGQEMTVVRSHIGTGPTVDVAVIGDQPEQLAENLIEVFVPATAADEIGFDQGGGQYLVLDWVPGV
jgi:hypothetical protein